jgi:hypothetical protein
MTVVFRSLVLFSYAVWQGGFFFYAAVVVPLGTEILESAKLQGSITQLVTHWLNLISLIALVSMALEMRFNRRSRPRAWWLWALMLVSQILLFILHPVLDRNFQSAEMSFLDRPAFQFWHGVYLWTHTVQWLAGLIWVIVTVQSWTPPPGESSAKVNS